MATPRTLTHLQRLASSAAVLLNAPAGKKMTLERLVLEDIAANGVITVTPTGDNPMGDDALEIVVTAGDEARSIEIGHTYETSALFNVSGASNKVSAIYRVY